MIDFYVANGRYDFELNSPQFRETLQLDVPITDVVMAGPPGPPGTPATIEIGAVTVTAPGQPASVTNTGTPNAAILDFVIPQGARGPDGPPGGVTVAALYAAILTLPDIASGFPVPSNGLYLNAGVLCIA